MTAFASFARQAFDPSTSYRSTSEASSQRKPLYGSCRYRPLTQEAGATSEGCGCQRFWLHRSLEPSTCFCGHHACYHQDKDEAKCILSNLSDPKPGHLADFNATSALTSPLRAGTLNATLPENESANSPLPANRRYTGSSSNFVEQRMPHKDGLHAQAASPAIYQESWARTAALKTPTVGSSILPDVNHAGWSTHMPIDKRPRLGLSTDTCKPCSKDPIYRLEPDDEGSLTEIATPSERGSPSAAECTTPSGGTPAASGHEMGKARREHGKNLPPLLSNQDSQGLQCLPETADLQLGVSCKRMSRGLSGLECSLNGLTSRVEALENVSFWHAVPRDVHDKVELLEGRVLDLEQQMEEVEKLRTSSETARSILGCVSTKYNNSSNLHEHCHSPCSEDYVVASEAGSLDITTTACPQIEELAPKLARHDQAPTLDVEIVVLPWGRSLTGVWGRIEGGGDESHDVTNLSRGQTPSSRDLLHSRPHAFDEWSPCAHEESCFAQACALTPGLRGRVYRRLKSSGLVRQVSLPRGSALDCYAALSSVFVDALDTLLMKETTEDLGRKHSSKSSWRENSLLGLEAMFIPLRKIHKSSRLRFLTSAELMTPALWTADFLEHLCMKVPSTGTTRLYITTPSAYLQRKDVQGWRWDQLRQLPRSLRSTREESHEVRTEESYTNIGETDAVEASWRWHAVLDGPQDAQGHHLTCAKCLGVSRLQQHRRSQCSKWQQERSQAWHSPTSSHRESQAADFESDRPVGTDSVEWSSVASEYAPVTPVSEYNPASRLGQDSRSRSFPGVGGVRERIVAHKRRKSNACTHESRSRMPGASSRKRRRLPRHPLVCDECELLTEESLSPKGPGSSKDIIEKRSTQCTSRTRSGDGLGSDAYATPFSHPPTRTYRHGSSKASSAAQQQGDVSDMDFQSNLDFTDEDVWEGVIDLELDHGGSAPSNLHSEFIQPS
ncbi:MAG: hypothetical protein M1828_006826 [Chrysothrix sp. TS-e1954]|nr:MAG: hypothetical protein M1828_006826 [Chrysothrix sp. TS-e1954]